MKQVVVLGSSGFIGSEITSTLSGKFQILGIDRVEGVNTHWVKEISHITKEDWSGRVEQNANVIFVAGKSNIRESLSNPVEDYVSYVGALSHVLDMLGRNQRLTLFSSAAVYSGKICPSDGFTEKSELASVNMYGWHRIAAETLLQQRLGTEHSAGYDILRPFSVFGSTLKRQVIWDLSKRIKETQNDLKIDGTGGETRDFIHVRAIPKFLEKLFETPSERDIWNLCSGTQKNIGDLARDIGNLLGKKIDVTFSGVGTNPIHLCGSNAKIRNFWLDTKQFDTESLLSETIGHLRNS
jgi:UDP-glucose 4-epimerase